MSRLCDGNNTENDTKIKETVKILMDKPLTEIISRLNNTNIDLFPIVGTTTTTNETKERKEVLQNIDSSLEAIQIAFANWGKNKNCTDEEKEILANLALKDIMKLDQLQDLLFHMTQYFQNRIKEPGHKKIDLDDIYD